MRLSDCAQFWKQHGDREQRLLAEPPFGERKDSGGPRLLDLVRQESRQALELGDRPINYSRGSV